MVLIQTGSTVGAGLEGLNAYSCAAIFFVLFVEFWGIIPKAQHISFQGRGSM